MSGDATCRHCGQRIVRVRVSIFGEHWTHQVAGASFQDGQHTYCHLTRAEPEPDPVPEEDSHEQ